MFVGIYFLDQQSYSNFDLSELMQMNLVEVCMNVLGDDFNIYIHGFLHSHTQFINRNSHSYIHSQHFHELQILKCLCCGFTMLCVCYIQYVVYQMPVHRGSIWTFSVLIKDIGVYIIAENVSSACVILAQIFSFNIRSELIQRIILKINYDRLIE